MSVSSMRDRSIDYAPCRYNGSRLWFRGPRRALRSPYVACLGGCEVYGRFLSHPWPAQLGATLTSGVVNLGVENAGIDAYLNDPGALATAANARVAVIQLTGSHNTSNRYYTVHPRRNDRFLKASESLKALYPEMDFTEVHFTRHLLSRLRAICPDRFESIACETRQAWQQRMRQLIGQLNGKIVLLWFAPKRLSAADIAVEDGEIFLDRPTVDALAPHVREMVEVVVDDWSEGRSEMVFAELEAHCAERLPGPAAHRQAMEALLPVIAPLVQ
ncbi:DUF6473 family protein [Marivita sp. S2033]|uniref:DUF6473 family protein n=1 Tax=Marivita sp. S2033 TaxID=3373187 RepID=UPI003981A47D